MVPHGNTHGRTADFHAQHSPVGALASFTIGRFGASGGPGCELSGPADGGVVAGYLEQGTLHTLPFAPMGADELARYVQGGGGGEGGVVHAFPVESILREYGWGTDRWSAGDVRFELLSPVPDLPDPAGAPVAQQRDAFLPAIIARLTVRNPSATTRRMVFAVTQGSERWLPTAGLAGWRNRGGFGMATLPGEGVGIANHFDVRNAYNPGAMLPADGRFGLGHTVCIHADVAPGAERTLTIALGWFRGGAVTMGVETRFWYTRLFSGIEDVLSHALSRAGAIQAQCSARDAELAAAKLSDEQRFLVAHASRSYYGSTQLLDDGGRPRWIVNEGEYLMMNTFDLTVDMAFHELRFSPWSLRNVLEQFVTEYRYEDQVFDPADPAKRLFPGGVSFAHDMGVRGVFSPAGRSSYEIMGLDRVCFSHMTTEQLQNWVCCAGIYWAQERDAAFLARHTGLLRSCLDSLQQRDHPDPAKRLGINQCESSRTHPGGEITTYDSLDHSLGQSRLNLYLAVKGWASCLVLETMLRAAGDENGAVRAQAQAALASRTIVSYFDERLGYIPAVLDGRNGSAIIPAIEGLIFPHRMGLAAALREDGPYGALIRALKRHHRTVLQQGVCLYPDGGWKLSSTADNSWMSKICLCQHIERAVLGMPQDAAGAARADRAHADWERIGSAGHACSDQFTSGVAKGSLYYPRIVTTTLWLDG
jgi:xylan 1,4-beta-xylosidase